MYVTRPLSLLRSCPDALSESPLEGPKLGYLVIQDEEAEDTFCFGLCEEKRIRDLPFPQNKEIKILSFDDAVYYCVVLIPEVGQPLSSNRYYIIESRGKNKGFLKRKGWMADTKTIKFVHLDGAQGLSDSLRSCLPDFGFNICRENSEVVVVGKWYCPFMFTRDEKLRDQMEESMYYKMELQQRWERIHSCGNDQSQGNRVEVDVSVQNEVISIGGREASKTYVNNGFMWIKVPRDGGKEKEVGLSMVIVERIKWGQQRVGWVRVDGRQVRIQKVEEFPLQFVGPW